MLRAIAVFQFGPVEGWVKFEQRHGGKTRVQTHVINLVKGKHGFHVHEKGNLEDLHASCAHFNPTNEIHGGPNSTHRHVGDLGNLQSMGEHSWVDTVIIDSKVSLSGAHSIIGRTIVIHAKEDDLGKGKGANYEESIITGNSGARLASAVIGIN